MRLCQGFITGFLKDLKNFFPHLKIPLKKGDFRQVLFGRKGRKTVFSLDDNVF